jgi:hypothetical protein
MAKVNIQDVIREEYKRCLMDPKYFIRKYCYIQEPVRGRILFDLYKYQAEAIDDFEGHKYNIILKGRQIGISTVVACYALWMMLFHKDKNVLVIATKQDTAKNLIFKVQFAYDNLPVWLQVPCTENNKLSLRFKNGSTIKAATAAGDSGRSEALSLLILDEAAFIKNAHEIWVAALPTLSTGGQAILISTPNGVGNFFHKTYSDAISGIAQQRGDDLMHFNAIKLDWRVHPERDQKWRDQMGLIQGERAARQEYDAEFIGSGNTVIDADLVEFYAKSVLQPIEKTGLDGNVWVFERPDPRKSYMLVADVARGDGSDYSAFHILDIETCNQVVEYKGKIGTTDYAHMLIRWATEYMDALLVVERENHGWAVLQTIIDRGYKNLFYMSKDRQVIEIERNITNRYHAEEKKLVPGFGTTMRTRPLIINKLDTYMREVNVHPENGFQVRINSIRTIEELRVFIWENGKAQAQQGYNDDLVMSLGIGLWVRDTALKLYQEGINITRNALEGFRRSGPVESEGVYTNNQPLYDPFKISMGGNALNPQEEDLRWLLR